VNLESIGFLRCGHSASAYRVYTTESGQSCVRTRPASEREEAGREERIEFTMSKNEARTYAMDAGMARALNRGRAAAMPAASAGNAADRSERNLTGMLLNDINRSAKNAFP
jgi:hypothetical protein